MNKYEAGIDYLTATTQSNYRRLQDMIGAWFSTAALLQLKVSGFNGQGYKGYACYDGEFVWGEREDGCLVRIWGERAKHLWYETFMLTDNVTRVDLQVTVELSEPNPNLALDLYNATERDGRRARSIIQSDTGQTLYIGSRSSRIFLRLYDKGGREKATELGRVWRYEVEIKDPQACTGLVADLANVADTQDVIASIVYDEFYKRGVEPLYEVGIGNTIDFNWTKHHGEQKLKWLRQQVRPTVQRLIALNLRDEVIDALGLAGEIDSDDAVPPF